MFPLRLESALIKLEKMWTLVFNFYVYVDSKIEEQSALATVGKGLIYIEAN